MSNWQLKTPVAFFVFKRPDTTQKVFEQIRRAKPPKLLVVADGHRPDKVGEAEQCAATRAIIDLVDWDCEVLTNYSEVNLGCKRCVAEGLDWVFSQVEEAIILEDDCLPHPSFFQFCEELLIKYRDDERVVNISGTNLLSKWKAHTQSYSFSNYFHCWGWATWRRVWQYYDVEMKLWSQPRYQEKVRNILACDRQYFNRKRHLDHAHAGEIDSWDYQFFFLCLARSGLSIRPAVNLISNIGFTVDSTHTVKPDNRSNLPTTEMSFPLRHPLDIVADRDRDYREYRKFWENNLQKRIVRKVRQLILILN